MTTSSRQQTSDPAWDIVQRPDPRRSRYGATPDQLKTFRRRESFRRNLVRDGATGCWLWQGATTPKGHPVIYIWTGRNNSKRSAFVWMMGQWFAEVPFPDRTRGTITTCGRQQCVNPRHRARKTYAHVTRLTPDQVREIWSAKDSGVTTGELCERLGVAQDTIWSIQSGRAHVDITGARKPERITRKLTPTQARNIYARRETGRTQREVASEFGVHPSMVSAIWRGVSWSYATGASLSGSQSA